jgi:hypothetical protein
MTTNFTIYNNKQKLFSDLIVYNNKNPIFLGDYNIPISNKYYIMLMDMNDKDINKIIEYLYNEDRDLPNPFDESLTVDNNIGFDKDQVYQINLNTDNIKQIDMELINIFANIEESNGELCLILDINYLLNLLQKIDYEGKEMHLYDFLIYKLYKKLDNMLIFDINKDLEYNSSPNMIYTELTNKLIKTNNILISLDQANNFILYKKEDCIYWKILLDDKLNININDLIDKVIYHEIDGEEYMLTSQTMEKIFSSNIFDHKNTDEPLHPLSKKNLNI